jgi:hypothetical protein
MHDSSSSQVRGDRVRPWSTDAEFPMLALRDNLSQNHNNAQGKGHEGHRYDAEGRFNTPSFALLSSKHAVFREEDSSNPDGVGRWDEPRPCESRDWGGEEGWRGVGEPLPRDALKGESSVADWSEGTCRKHSDVTAPSFPTLLPGACASRVGE